MDIQEFADTVKVPFSMCIASKRNTGKSVLLNQFIVRMVESKKVDVPIIFSNTTGLNDDYPDIPKHLKQPYSEEALQRLINHQKKTPKEKRKNILVVFDDVLGDKKADRSSLILYCYAIGRHINLNPVLASQVSNRVLTPTVKANSDYILLSRLNRQHIINIWEAITNMEKGEFIAFIEDVNKDYKFCVVDMTSQSNEPADFLRIVKARPPKKKSEEEAKENREPLITLPDSVRGVGVA
jgi:hypothetical protein